MFLFFQEAPRDKPRLLWVFLWILWEYEPKPIQNFWEIFIFCKTKCKRHFPWRIPTSPIPYYLTPAVNRQPGFRRDTRRASFLLTSICFLFRNQFFRVHIIICCVSCKIRFLIFRICFSFKSIFPRQKSTSFDPEKLAFSSLVEFKIFDFFIFRHFLVPESDFVAILTIFLCFQKAPRGKPRLLWMVCEVLWKYQPKRIQNFREIFIFHKKYLKRYLEPPVNCQPSHWREGS